VGKKEPHSLALIDIMLPMKPTVGKQTKEKEKTYLEHHGIFMVEKPLGLSGQQVVDISCFQQVAHVVPTDIGEKRFWVNNYVNLETYNDVYDKKAW
jgi:hypothetical protein